MHNAPVMKFQTDNIYILNVKVESLQPHIDISEDVHTQPVLNSFAVLFPTSGSSGLVWIRRRLWYAWHLPTGILIHCRPLVASVLVGAQSEGLLLNSLMTQNIMDYHAEEVLATTNFVLLFPSS